MDNSEEEKLNSHILPRLISSLSGEERPITVDEACALRLLLFGDTNRSFGTEWTNQSFKFRTLPTCYGLRQKASGPCGLLAAVQAYLLCELLFGFSRCVLDSGLLRPKLGEKKEALARALSSILWQAGEYKKVLVAMRREDSIFDQNITQNILKGDGFIEYIKLKCFVSEEFLLEHIYNFICEMIDDQGSCVLFLYSVLLTHGIEKIKGEMDYPDSHLIGDDGYCSQEVVNLILTGKAVPNLFDGDVELNSGGNETTLHRGISRQSKIGLLSLYEYREACTVGQFYKNPVYPIWVLLIDSHFTVLFATKRDIFKKDQPDDSFTLYHYDTIKKNNQERSFTIRPNAREEEAEKNQNIDGVFRCVFTRWPLAIIDELEGEDEKAE